MELLLERDRRRASDTTGQLYELPKREWLCFVLEDQVRTGPKVLGATAIPAGRYEIQITRSNRFGVLMPLLLNVPCFAGIRIHPGNSSADTEGCLLPGLTRSIEANGTQRVTDSRVAYNRLYLRLENALARGRAFITIANL